METTMMSSKEREDAVREAKVLKKMHHPNIIRFQEVFMTKRKKLCIVMDFADGGDLHQWMKSRNGELVPEQTLFEFFVQICEALHHVHSQKVLHRDLKSQNIFLMQTGRVLLGDFGISRILEATKDFARTMVGTPYYLSPEIIEERPYNYKSDIWSLGVILYELTTLKHPFDAESLHFLAIRILKGDFPSPDPMYSPGLEELIRALLRKDPEARPALRDVLADPLIQPARERVTQKFDLPRSVQEPSTLKYAQAGRPIPGDESVCLYGSVAPGAALSPIRESRETRGYPTATTLPERQDGAAWAPGGAPPPVPTSVGVAATKLDEDVALASVRPATMPPATVDSDPPQTIEVPPTMIEVPPTITTVDSLAISPSRASDASATRAGAEKGSGTPGSRRRSADSPDDESYEEDFEDYEGSEDDDFKMESNSSYSVKAEKLRDYLENKFGPQKFATILRAVQSNIDNIAKVEELLGNDVEKPSSVLPLFQLLVVLQGMAVPEE